MKKFSIILMVVGFLLVVLGIAIVYRAHIPAIIIIGSITILSDLVRWLGVEGGIIFSIFGSSLFGSGMIALAITQALGKKP